ncbi:phage tail tip fiber protein [Kosakonia radicincitans]|uniref:phage tail tip fiber protein n=1 Tax=Kosakonia radicincitans TaxID=283686 RepID=UPI002367F82C|nr:fibronectin type III domain-containing protein [Kosakonia radicincitans]MDD7993760.1 fibronectin type III domain-containing protein [Kosakonia radicincitans]
MGKSLGNFFSAIVTAVVVAAAVYFSGGTALAAIGWGAAAGAASLVATSMLGQVGVQDYGDVTDTLSRSTSPTTGLPVLYGGQLPHKNGVSLGAFILTGSIVSWYNIPGGDSQYLFSEQAVCMAGTQKYIKQIYIDNEPVLAVPITADGVVPSSSISTKYRDYLQLEVRFGGNYTTTKTLASQYAGSKWQNNFYGKGVVSISVVIKKTQTSLENNILTNDNFTLTCEMKGQLIYDLVSGTTIASSNPPSIIYDYLTDAKCGMAIDPGLIDLDSFIECAHYCDQMEYYANGSMSYQSTYKENIESVLQSFGGIMYVHAGQICMTVDRKTVSVASYNERNMFGEIQLTTSGNSDYFNCIDAKYTNVGTDGDNSMYSTDVLRIPSDISVSEAINTDGQIITLSRDYTWIYDTDKVSALANAEVLKAKYALRTITFTTSEGWDLNVWDSITISNGEFSLSNAKFKVLSKDVATDQESVGYVTITAIEYPDAIFDGTDPGVWSPGGSIGKPAMSVIAPTNLQINRKGNLVDGSSVEMTWTASDDPYLRGYYVYYKLSSASVWSYAGSTSPFKTDYELFGLNDTDQYDFAVAAYNNLGLVSNKLTAIGLVPSFNFALPSVTGLRLVNSTESAYITNQSNFLIQWDNQSNIKVNGKAFSQYFKYYVVRIFDGTTLVNTYYTTDTQFNLTLDLNTSKIRKPTIGVYAQGYTSGTYGEEVQITVENKQAGLVAGVTFTGGFGNLFASWTESDEPDYAGANIIIRNGISTSSFYSNKPSFDSIPNIVDGTYYVKMGLYDVFGTDNIQYTDEVTLQINSKYQFTEDDTQQINNILDLDNRLDEILQNAVNESNEYTNTQVTQINNKIDDDISASITQMNQTIVANNSAQTLAINQLRSDVDGDIATVNTSMATKADKSTVDAQYSLSVNANGTVAGMRLVASSAGATNSAIYFVADKFLVAPSSGVTTGGVAPFAIVNGSTYLNNAIIQSGSIGSAYIADAAITTAKVADASINTAKIVDASITTAKIASTIQSTNYVANTSGWQINKAGTFYINGTGGTGRMVISNNIIQIYDNNNTLRVRMGLW